MWSSYFPFHFPFSHKVKSAEVGVALEKAHTHTLSPGREVRFTPQRSVGLRAPPHPPGAAQPSLPRPGRRDEKGLRAVLAGGGGGGCSECKALRAQHSVVRRPPPPAGCRLLPYAAGSQPRPLNSIPALRKPPPVRTANGKPGSQESDPPSSQLGRPTGRSAARDRPATRGPGPCVSPLC